MVPEVPRDWSWRVAKYFGSGMARAVPRRERMEVHRAWHEVWNRDIRAELDERGTGRGCSAETGEGGAMLKASLGSPCCGYSVSGLKVVLEQMV